MAALASAAWTAAPARANTAPPQLRPGQPCSYCSINCAEPAGSRLAWNRLFGEKFSRLCEVLTGKSSGGADEDVPGGCTRAYRLAGLS